MPARVWAAHHPRISFALEVGHEQEDQVRGTAEKMKGKVNETIGRATGDRKQEVKGDVQQAVGEARKKAGDIKEAVKDTTTQKP
jgi:uncharacterized protein YjbJ (UPF0337 family)